VQAAKMAEFYISKARDRSTAAALPREAGGNRGTVELETERLNATTII
jgi:hypothetical protein